MRCREQAEDGGERGHWLGEVGVGRGEAWAQWLNLKRFHVVILTNDNFFCMHAPQCVCVSELVCVCVCLCVCVCARLCVCQAM